MPKPANLADARAQFDAADQELNRVYRQCVAPERSTVQAIAHLKQAQQLWVQYRDENAAAYQTGQSSRAVTKDEYYYLMLRSEGGWFTVSGVGVSFQRDEPEAARSLQ